MKKDKNMDNNQRLKFFNDKKIIGIDPGKTGAIAIYSVTKNEIIEILKMPETPMDILTILKIYSKNSKCYLEKVGGIPGTGGAMAMFHFGCGYGYLQMALLSCKIPFVEVTPQKWMKFFQLGTRGNLTHTEWKNKLKNKAQQLFPFIKNITLVICDSLLILEYGKMIEKN